MYYFLAVRSAAPANLRVPGKVVERGDGLAEDAPGTWLVTQSRCADIPAVRKALRKFGAADHVVRIHCLPNAHQGRDYARQLPLL